MWIQAKVKTFQESDVFDNAASARPIETGTVARGKARLESAFYTGYKNGKPVDAFPVAVTKELLKRGQDRFEIFCMNCHGAVGNGHGMISQRGLKLMRDPANYHTDRLRKMPVGHFFDVITNGYGIMYGFKDRIDPKDRWAIAAYIRVLQLSQHAKVSDVPPETLKKLQDRGSETQKTQGRLNK
jgi:mono/diheme cytochrome c family protein